MDTILVVNAGSSSVKFQVFGDRGDVRLKRLIKGQMDGIGTRPRLRAEAPTAPHSSIKPTHRMMISDVPAAIREAGAWLRTSQKLNLIAVGHRVVHGGPEYSRPVLIDDEIVAETGALHSARSIASAQQSRADTLTSEESARAASSRVFRYGISSTIIRQSQIITRSLSVSTRKASAATGFTDCRTNLLPSACGSSFRKSRSPA